MSVFLIIKLLQKIERHDWQTPWIETPGPGLYTFWPGLPKLSQNIVEAASKPGSGKPVRALEDDWERISPVDGNRRDKTGQTR